MLSFNRFIHINRIKADTNISRCGFRAKKIGLTHLMGCSVVVIVPILSIRHSLFLTLSLKTLSLNMISWLEYFDHLLLSTTKPFILQIIFWGDVTMSSSVKPGRGVVLLNFQICEPLVLYAFYLKALIKNTCSSVVLSWSTA